MKNCKPTFCLLTLTISLLLITNCKKSSQNDGTLIGKWISADMVDTLQITSDQDLYKMINGVRDHYIYSLSGDSILITYNGVAMPYIYIGPSKMRFYKLNGNNLTIDFRNAYYGFSNQLILFHRQ
jgi:hypothetical protein